MRHALHLRALFSGVAVSLIVSVPALGDAEQFAGLVPRSAVGDMNGDGFPDAVVQPGSSSESGQVLHGTNGSAVTAQSFPANFLGLGWSTDDAALHLGDFDGNGQQDVYLQPKDEAGEHAILLSNEQGLLAATAQRFDAHYLGLNWHADASQAVLGDWDGEGRADVLLQAKNAGGTHTVVLTDEAAGFAFGVQSWVDGFLGRTWNADDVALHPGDFDGDGQFDLLVQVLDDALLVGPHAQSAYALVTAGPGGVFSSIFATWERDELGADWSPATHELIVQDVDRDGIADTWLHARIAGGTDYLALGTPKGFQSLAASWIDEASPEAAYQRALDNASANTTGSGVEQFGIIGGGGDEGGGMALMSQQEGGGTTSGTRNAYSNYTVGATPSRFSVDQMGGAHYSIPLNTPPGIAGVQPGLALTYSSRGGNGLAGMGWSVAGLSAITRCEQNVAQDGTNAPITYTTSDKYCLDGQRLRKESGTYGAHGATYRTEIDRFARITSYTSGGSGTTPTGGPKYFKVETRDGMIYEYGLNDNSRIEAQGTTVARVWALSKVSDRFGNWMDYTYTEDTTNGDYRPSQIAWTARSGQSAIYSVDFVYEDRPASDVVIGYEAGSVIKSLKRLTRLDVKHTTNVIRKYVLAYDTGTTSATKRSRLLSVQECPSSGDCLPPHTFTWQNGQKGWATPTNSGYLVGSGSTAEKDNAIVMDATGDGRDDMLVPRNGYWWIAKSTSLNSLELAQSTSRTYYSTYYQYALPVDYDADGYMDLLVPGQTSWEVLRWNPTLGTPNFDAAITTSIPSTSNTRGNGHVADVDGDGYDDFIYATGYALKVMRRNPTSGNTFHAVEDWLAGVAYIFQTNPFGTIESRARAELRVANLNGDNRADLLVKAVENICGGEPGCDNPPADWVAFTSTGTAFSYIGQTYQSGVEPLPADLNGDGLTDIAYVRDGYWRLMFSKGNGLSLEVNTSVASQGTTKLLAMDWDDDGKTDILGPKSGSTNWWVMRSTGTTLEALVDTGISGSPDTRRVADMDGDGLSEIMQITGTGTYWQHAYHYGPVPDLAVGFTDSLGNTWAPAYSSLVDSSVYTRGTGATFPSQEYLGSLHVVSQAVMPDGLGATYTVDYNYTGARIHRQGRGFLGFATQKITDNRTGITRTTTFDQTFPKVGMASSVQVKQSGGADISSVTNTLASTSTGGTNDVRYFVYASNTTSIESEVGGTLNGTAIRKTTVDRTFDSYGNLETEDVKTGAGAWTSGNHQFRSYSDPTYTNYTTSPDWCLGRATATSAQNTIVSGSQTATRTSTATHNGTTCRLLTETLPNDSTYTTPNLEFTKTLGYDSYGNVSSVALSGPAITTRTTTISHSGTNGYFPTSVTNPLSQAMTTTWDMAAAQPSQRTDANGLSEYFYFDAFKRINKHTRVGNVATEISLAWWNPSGSCGGTTVECIKTTLDEKELTGNTYAGKAITTTDAFGRTVRSERRLLSDANAMVYTKYNANGRVEKQSVPYYTASLDCVASPTATGCYWITPTYDLVGRVVTDTRPASEASPAGNTTTFAYEGFLTKITDDNSKLTKRTINARGEVVQMIDAANGTTAYAYDPFGNLKSTTDPASNQVTMSYDIRGNKRAMSDPDMGSWTYAYNALGQLTSQVDAKSQTTTLGYDLLGRLTSRQEVEGTTTWVYDTASGKGVGKLHYVSQYDGYQKTLTYNSTYGQLITQTETIDSTNYAVDFSFDNFGRLETLTYPTSTSGVRFKVDYDYDSRGNLWKVKNFDSPYTVFWTNTTMNALGQVTKETLGNSVITERILDNATGRPTLIKSGVSGGTGIQQLTYGWDAVGNLTSRGDTNRSQSETFTYDDLYRLTSNGATYSAIGNLETLNLNGVAIDLVYSGSKPHAVSSSTGAVVGSYSYDANGNMTSKAGETLTWTSFNYLASVPRGSNSATFNYAPDRMRYKQVAGLYSGYPETTIYVGGVLEKMTRNGVTEWRHFIRAGSQVIAQHTRRSDSTNYTRYLHRDHLGSIESITNESGTVQATLSFDAWGRRRDPSNWSTVYAWNSGSIQPLRNDTPRGYTGHEMLDSTGLTHMNGRVYDQYLGRMLSADPTVPGAFNSQAYNRYSYVFNNPISFTDPSGFGPFGFGDQQITHADGGAGIEVDYISGSGHTCVCVAGDDEEDGSSGGGGTPGGQVPVTGGTSGASRPVGNSGGSTDTGGDAGGGASSTDDVAQLDRVEVSGTSLRDAPSTSRARFLGYRGTLIAPGMLLTRLGRQFRALNRLVEESPFYRDENGNITIYIQNQAILLGPEQRLLLAVSLQGAIGVFGFDMMNIAVYNLGAGTRDLFTAVGAGLGFGAGFSLGAFIGVVNNYRGPTDNPIVGLAVAVSGFFIFPNGFGLQGTAFSGFNGLDAQQIFTFGGVNSGLALGFGGALGFEVSATQYLGTWTFGGDCVLGGC